MKTDTGIQSSGATPSSEPIKVMVVDDSAVVRGLINRMLDSDPAVTVVASVGNGQIALGVLERQEVDVVVLDIEMPVMDGMTALPKMLKINPSLQVIMASTLTLKNAEISMRALEAGAADYIPKPTSTKNIAGESDFREILIAKVKALGMRRRVSRGGARPSGAGAASPSVARPSTFGAAGAAAQSTSAATRPVVPLHGSSKIVLRNAMTEIPQVLAIGSSTGGPQALFAVLSGLRAGSIPPQPILITQHMPATFTTILAEHISRVSGWTAAEAKDGEAIKSGRVYIAPGDFHMIVESKGLEKVLRLNKNPPENFCRPAVDPMLRSVAQVWGKGALVCILTGMGYDGMKGGQAIVAAGGTVVAQDEATSVVWGMPGAVATAGVCSAVLPLPEIAPYLQKLMMRRS